MAADGVEGRAAGTGFEAVTSIRTVPVGLWGLSQGAWAAPLTAIRHEVAFLVLVSNSGVSSAAQMRYGTAEQLRRHGLGATDLADVDRLRRTVERYLRGGTGREPAQAAIDDTAARPWFPLVYLLRELPAQPGTWRDIRLARPPSRRGRRGTSSASPPPGQPCPAAVMAA